MNELRVGNRLRQWRADRGLTQADLAKLARLLQVDCLIWLAELSEAASLFGSCLQSHETGRMRIRRDFVGARLLHSFGYRKLPGRSAGWIGTGAIFLALAAIAALAFNRRLPS